MRGRSVEMMAAIRIDQSIDNYPNRKFDASVVSLRVLLPDVGCETFSFSLQEENRCRRITFDPTALSRYADKSILQ